MAKSHEEHRYSEHRTSNSSLVHILKKTEALFQTAKLPLKTLDALLPSLVSRTQCAGRCLNRFWR